MKSSRVSTLLTGLLLLSLTACYIQIVPNDPAATPQPGNPAVETAQVETQIAAIIQATLGAMTNPPPSPEPGGGDVLPTATIATDTPTPSPTSSLTPTLTFTATLGVPRLSVSTATNCRSGPGTAYPTVGDGIQPGETADVIGRGTNPNYWIIRDPGNPPVICWAWGEYATVSGDLSALPIFTPPPTPTPVVTNTPTSGYTVSYLGTINCAGNYAFRFFINNTGGTRWESIQIVLTDTTTATSTTHTLDAFRSYSGCPQEMNTSDLNPGEGSNVSNINPGQVAYNPAGHNFTAVFTVCSLNGLAGSCLNKSISFTP